MYSIAPVLLRKACDDYVIPNTSVLIEKGTKVIIPVDAIQHDPEIYPDPFVFDPNRFSAKENKKRPSLTWLAFGDGPRNCIGLKFAKMQITIGLALLLKNFKFTISKKTQTPLEFNIKNFMLSSKDGIFLKVEKI